MRHRVVIDLQVGDRVREKRTAREGVVRFLARSGGVVCRFKTAQGYDDVGRHEPSDLEFIGGRKREVRDG